MARDLTGRLLSDDNRVILAHTEGAVSIAERFSDDSGVHWIKYIEEEEDVSVGDESLSGDMVEAIGRLCDCHPKQTPSLEEEILSR